MNSAEGPFRKAVHDQSSAELFLTKLGMHPGTRIKLVKVSSDGNSNISIGDSLEGVLDADIAIGKSIFLDGKSKNTSSLVAVKEENKRIFFKTHTSTYELVPPSTAANYEVNPEGLKNIENHLKSLLKEVQDRALSAEEMKILSDQRISLQNSSPTRENIQKLRELDEEIKKHKIFIKTLVQFRMLMNMLGKNYYRVNDVVTHENAHANKASSLGVVHEGYSVLVYKSKTDDGFSYQPLVDRDIPRTFNDKEKVEVNLKIGFAPEEYGNHLSDGDEEQIRKLREELKKYK
jgi:hypothetical protein